MLSDQQLQQIRSEVESAENPLFLFDDDPDGIASMLLLYRMIRRGDCMMVKSVPKIDSRFLHRAQKEKYDKIIITDVATIDREFLDNVNKPIVWIDHHEPQSEEGVKYFNPRKGGHPNKPTSYVTYKVANNPNDLWIAMTGIVGDWYLPEFADEFAAKYPDLWSDKVRKPDDAIFETKLGDLIRLFSFIQKGPTGDANKCVRYLAKVNDPYDILEQKTEEGKFLYKKFESYYKDYKRVYDKAAASAGNDPFIIYTYKGEQGYSSEISNEILHHHPDKVIIIAREKDGEMRMSLRGSGKNQVRAPLKHALTYVNGYGGGHEHACGAAVKVEDWDRFVEKFKAQFKF